MNQQLSTVVIDSDARSRNLIVESLKTLEGAVRLVAAAGDLQEGLKGVPPAIPHIIIMEVKDLESGAKEIEFILSRSPQAAVFVSCVEKSTEWILGLIRAGAREYLPRPVSPLELMAAVKKVARLQAVKSGGQAKRGEVISVYNPSGGTGTTTIAVNLAAVLAAQGNSTALVDLNLSSGDISAFLDLSPRYTLASMLPKKGQIDSTFVKSIMTPHSCGVQILDSPFDLGEASQVQPELVKEVLAVLRTIFKYIVIDCGGPLFGCNLAAFESSDEVLFTTVLNLPALRNAKRYLAALDSEGFGADKVKVVINRNNPRDDIRVADAEKVLGRKVYQTLPNCYADVKSSILQGVPLVLCNPKSQLAKALEQFARQLCVQKDNVPRQVGF
ncbi:AAA family ATPase [Geomonas sp. RF6]|uniref:AAA family ATPase n=1 Tax=Geomonas sp. RF6 TaxID=2897342 RepID=UPI001E64CB88|nr:AAA family ATPase [Geomonas sp. RF6]UFS70010.1 AAA family ATPase [Geomonas sp. RF6]